MRPSETLTRHRDAIRRIATHNRLAHGYFTVDREIAWCTIRNDFPALEKRIESMRDNP